MPGQSAREVYACWTYDLNTANSPAVYVYFLANDDTGRILETSFIPEQ